MNLTLAKLCTVLIFFVITLTHSEGKHITGILKTSDNWIFLDRFCFLPNSGTLQFNFVYPKNYLTESLLLYWDKPNMWLSAYHNASMTCAQKEALLDVNSYQIFRLHPSYAVCEFRDNDTVSCASIRYRFKSTRERWWFMAISNCLSEKGLYLEYDIYMRNGEPGDFFREHFSADELYILEFNIAFALIELAMVVLVIAVSVKLTKLQMFHSTYKIFLASVVFFYASIIVTCIAYMIYGVYGLDNSGWKTFASVLYAVSQVLLILMLLLMGLGYTVVCGRLPHWAIICLSVFISSFTLTYIALYVVVGVTFDPALVLYSWESAPGYGLIALILAAWLFYLGCCVFTMVKHKKRKGAFYGPMIVFYTLWFIAIPVTVGINIKYVEYYTRAKVVNFVQVITLFLAHVFYLILTWPNLASKNFPFHIRTTQIDAITLAKASQEVDQESYRATDLTDGRQFTDFSIFTADPDDSAYASTGSVREEKCT